MQRVENFDDVCVHRHRVRNQNRAGQQRADGFGDGGLAVARRAKQKDGFAGIDRRTQLIQHRLTQNEMRKRALERILRHDLPGERLRHAPF